MRNFKSNNLKGRFKGGDVKQEKENEENNSFFNLRSHQQSGG